MFKKLFFIILLFNLNNLFSVNFGQFFILTLPNTDSHEKLGIWLEETQPAGIMLLTQHVQNRDKTKKLINFLQDKAQELKIPKLIVATDWEGGIVSRPGEQGGFFSVPAPKNLGEQERTYSFLTGKLIGQQMRDVGINMNFAPSLDLFDPDNYVLGSRTFSSDPKKVFECALSFAAGLESEGIIPVYKHFPGLGLGGLDTHLNQVEVKTSKENFKKHVSPFVEVLKNENNPCIMATHAKFINIFENLPTTLSPEAVKYIKNKNKNSLLITDDFFMKGVQIKDDIAQLVLDSLNAGFDLIIYSAQKAGQEIELINNLNKKLILNNKLNNIINFKNNNLKNFNKNFILPEKELSQYLASKTVKEFYENLDINNSLLITVDITKIRPYQDWFIKKNKSYFAKKLKKSGAKNIKELIFDAKDKECVNKVLDFINKNKSNYKNIILSTFFYGQGVWDKTQEDILKNLQEIFSENLINNNLILISLAHPYEQNIFNNLKNNNIKIFNLGSFSKPLLNEVVNRLTDNKLPEQDLIFKNLKDKLENKKFGLLCHNASYLNINNKKLFLPDLLYKFTQEQKDNTKLVALFSPEHGLMGNLDAFAFVKSQDNSKWGCPIYSLHGEHKSPTKEMLEGLDVFVIDLHEVGLRVYTYLSTLKLCLDSCAQNNIPVIVINYPNPIYFWPPQGPELQKGFESLVGKIYTKFIHGQNIGEIALSSRASLPAEATRAKAGTRDLDIINIYKKTDYLNYFKANNYLPASPNLATLEAVYCYPITVFIEGTNYSEGRGTGYPFQQIGAPWVDGKKLAKVLNSKKLPGIYFEPVEFVPVSINGRASVPKHKGKICQGVFLHLYDLNKVKPADTGKIILETLFNLYPEKSQLIKFGGKNFLDKLVGNDSWSNFLVKP